MTRTVSAPPAPPAPTAPTGAARARTLVLLFLAVVGALLAAAQPAAAHAALTGSDPRQGAVLDKAPDQVSLTFSEQVAMSADAVRVLDPQGKRVDAGQAPTQVGRTYSVKLRAGVPDGTFTVAYQVVSADSHPVAGAFTFSIGAPSATSVALNDQNTGGGPVGVLYGIARYVTYAGFIVMVGGAAFVLACWRGGSQVPALRRLVVSGWLALTAATLALLALRGAYSTSGKIGDVFDLDLLGQVLQTKTGAALICRLLLCAAAALFVAVLFGTYDRRQDAGERRDLTFGLAAGGTVVTAGLAATWALAEHASTGIQPGVAMPVDVVHLLAVALWLGGLAALLVSLHLAPEDTPVDGAAVRRFSRVAFGSVLALVATGAYQGWRQVGSWSALTGTGYGQLLLGKIGLVAVMVGLAWFSRQWAARVGEGRPTVVRQRSRGQQSGAQVSPTETSRMQEKSRKDSDRILDDRVQEQRDTDTDTVTAPASLPDPKRAAQLARQKALVADTRRRRLRDADEPRAALRRSVLVETGVAVVLLAVTTVLTSTEPGRTVEEAKAAASSTVALPDTTANQPVSLDMPFDTGGEDGQGGVRIEITPGRVGANDVHIFVMRPDATAFDVPELNISMTLKSQDIGPLPVKAVHAAPGHWAASGVQIPLAGDWEFSAMVRTSEIDAVTVHKSAKIG